MEDLKDLRVWQKTYEMTLSIYRKSKTFPSEEMYGLTSQVRRAAVSIGANIAEGCGRRSDTEMRRFLQIARGSANELEYHLQLAKDLRYLSPNDFEDLNEQVLEVQRMLTSLAARVRSSIA